VENGGLGTRDFIYVGDIVRGLLLCALVGRAGDVYNLASGVETSVLELATLANRMTGSPVPIQLAPRRDWDRSGRRVGSTEKAKRLLGFEAQVAIEEGLARTISWTRANLGLIEACIRKHAALMPSGSGSPPLA